MRIVHLALLSLSLLGGACGSPTVQSLRSAGGKADGTGTARKVKIAQTLVRTNLVSDQADGSTKVDSNLVNPWGIAFNPAGPAWISNAGTGVASVYDATGALKLTVTIPVPAGATEH